MGCKDSKLSHQGNPLENTATGVLSQQKRLPVAQDPLVSTYLSDGLDPTEIDDFISGLQDAAKHKRDEEKVKLLLLGTGESGKSTIFKQYRILYGSPKTEDDLRYYGVIVRSNIVNAIRKLCLLVRTLEWEKRLDEESVVASAADRHDVSDMTPREAFDQICEYLVDNSATETFPDISKEQEERDWAGNSKRAGIQANLDARQFLQHVEAIRVLWQVSSM